MKESKLKEHLSQKWSSSIRLCEVDPHQNFAKADDCTILVTDRSAPQQILNFALEKEAKHVIQKSNLWLKEEINTSALMLKNPDDFLSYPLSSVMSPENANDEFEKTCCEFEFTFNKSTQKEELISKLETYLNSVSQSSVFINEACLMTDELFTNAVFNAPYTNLENTHLGFSRSEGVASMHPPKTGRIFAGRHNDRLLLGCEDPYGTLNLKKLLTRIKSCIDMGPDQVMRFEDGGAGIGSFLLYMTSTSIFLGVKKNVKTVIISALPFGVSNRRKNDMPKNIHYLEL